LLAASGFTSNPESRRAFEEMPIIINMGLSRKANVESGLDVKPRRARPEAYIYCVAALNNGMTI